MGVGDALEGVFEVSERLEIVELGGGDERADGGPANATYVRSDEQMVLATERDRSDRAFDGIGVEIDAPSLRKRDSSSQRASA